MKKNKKIFKYIKRGLLITIGVVIIIVASVFFLDVYKAAEPEYKNVYEDSYFQNLEESGFVHYDKIVTEEYLAEIDAVKTEIYNKLKWNHASYVAPYEATATHLEKINAARYSEELEKIKKEIENDLGVLTSDLEKAYNDKKATLTSYLIFLANYRANDGTNYYLEEVMNNGKFRLLLDPTTTEFVLEELDSDKNVINRWQSNPSTNVRDDSLKARQSSQLSVTFVNGDKTSTIAPIEYDNYTYSIFKNEDKLVLPNYYINFVKDEQGKTTKVLIYYILEERGIDYTWFPEKLTRERLDELLSRCTTYATNYKKEHGTFPVDSKEQPIVGLSFAPSKEDYSAYAVDLYSKVIDNVYTLGDDGVYVINNYSPELPGNSINYLYRFFYEWCQYTFDDIKVDTGQAKIVPLQPKVELAIEYALTDDGLSVLVPGNSIKTNANKNGEPYEITKIDVLPYFTSVSSKQNVDGYVVIPDGSGAVLEFDNQKASNYKSYNQRIYSSDLTFTSYLLTASTTDMLLPMYGFVYTGDENNDEKALIVEVLEGAPQVALSADTSGRGKNTFNYAYYSIYCRESQRIIIGTGYNSNETTQYTVNAALCDYKFNYTCLNTTKYDATYSGIAKCYRDMLMARNEKIKENDVTSDVVVDLDILGSYSYDTNFLGIGYEATDSLTTAAQVKEIVNSVLKLNADKDMNVNVYYHGWRKEGLVNTSFDKIKVSKEIGGKKALLDLIKTYKDSSVNLYPFVEFIELNEYQESFGNNHYTARDVGGSYSIKYPYELNSNVFNTKLDAIRSLSPAYYNAFAKELAKNYSKVVKSSNLAISGLGSSLSGNYRKKEEMFKVSAVEEQKKSFETLKAAGITKMALKSPYAYAFEYVSTAYDVPYQATQYEILDYSIPFYQLVVNGLFDYSGESINEKVEKGLSEHLMRCIETGSNLSFTFTYDDSTKLLQTNYNNYYFTLYSRWLTDVESAYKELSDLGIYACQLVGHERLDNNVYRVTYQAQDGKEIKIVLNYQRTAWNSIPAKSYKVVE